ncbi:hypothetical protein L6452_09727 [Arctium lappa]|uniref:Uncharacterized protein n=1 Tax=Arctium lappa TaxID=4217 RepID=A0ACB9DLR0_ARCLA|nr:hypothetical protein L6452_09727 [Arctium lappa]
MRSFAIRRPEMRSLKDMLPKADWLLKTRTVDGEIGHLTKTFDDNNRAPSFGCMVGDREISIPNSVNSSYDEPPSYGEVARRDGSQADESRVEKNLPKVDFEDANSIVLSFREIYLDDVIIVCVSHNGDWKRDWKYKNVTYI